MRKWPLFLIVATVLLIVACQSGAASQPVETPTPLIVSTPTATPVPVDYVTRELFLELVDFVNIMNGRSPLVSGRVDALEDKLRYFDASGLRSVEQDISRLEKLIAKLDSRIDDLESTVGCITGPYISEFEELNTSC